MNSDVTFTNLTPAEKLFMEKTLQIFRQTKQVADHASDGHVLDAIEESVVTNGHSIVQDLVEGVLTQAVKECEQQGAKPCPKCGKPMRNRGGKKNNNDRR